MLGKKIPGHNVKNSALASTTAEAHAGRFNPRKTEEKPRVWCDYCNKPRHTRETCWKLHGKPENWKGKHEGRFNSSPAAHEAAAVPFSKEQVDHILKLLKSNSGLSGTPSASLAQTGRESIALSCCFPDSAPWIIDSGASDHMTSFSHLFDTYTPCSGHEKIRIADGSFSPIAGKGLIKLSSSLTLKSVLHVPKLACNLLSVSKLSKDSNCHLTFFDSHCVFQERNSGRMIGSAKVIDGLYYLEDGNSKNKKAQGLSSISSISVKDQIMLWHYRLGHPSFSYLKTLFPMLFRGVDYSKLYCENCILSKSQRTNFSSKPYQSSKPFYLIHSDVWGPRIKTLSGKK